RGYVQTHGLALARALSCRWRGRPQAGQDPAFACATFATGDTPESHRKDGPGDAVQCHALEPRRDGRGHGDFAVERGAHLV
ncbi:hypothetical protein QU38_01985, partial [Staphylococcus aureus]